MPEYRRTHVAGGVFFFTVVTYQRIPIFRSPVARALLMESIGEIKRTLSFNMPAFVILPEHLHCIWELPDGDTDYSKRWGMIKRSFTRHWRQRVSPNKAISDSRKKKREAGIWQRRFWEHAIRDDKDYENHLNYIHYNPIKHGLVRCAHEWDYSTFQQWRDKGYYPSDWCCQCEGRRMKELDFSSVKAGFGE